MFKYLMIIGLMLSSVQVFAADPGVDGAASKDGNLEVGAHIGTLLPSQIPGLTELTGLGGVRVGYHLGGPVAEATLAMGHGDGASYQNTSLDLRFDVPMPMDAFVGFVFIGVDMTNYAGANRASTIVGGGNLGSGLMTQLGNSFWLRSDMKFAFNPGITLYINFGFMIRI